MLSLLEGPRNACLRRWVAIRLAWSNRWRSFVIKTIREQRRTPEADLAASTPALRPRLDSCEGPKSGARSAVLAALRKPGTASPFASQPLTPEYVLEPKDPRHRRGINLHHLHQEFTMQVPAPQQDLAAFFGWVDGRAEPIPALRYLPPREQTRWHVSFDGNKVLLPEALTRAGVPAEVMYVMDTEGQFYVHPKLRGDDGTPAFHHSSFFAGGPIAGAGYFKLDAQARLRVLFEESGHYHPRAAAFLRTTAALRIHGVKLEDVAYEAYAPVMEQYREDFGFASDAPVNLAALRARLRPLQSRDDRDRGSLAHAQSAGS